MASFQDMLDSTKIIMVSQKSLGAGGISFTFYENNIMDK